MVATTYVGYSTIESYGVKGSIDKTQFRLAEGDVRTLQTVVIVLSLGKPAGVIINTSPSRGIPLGTFTVYISNPDKPSDETAVLLEYRNTDMMNDMDYWMLDDRNIAQSLYTDFFSKDCKIRFRFVMEDMEIPIEPEIPIIKI